MSDRIFEMIKDDVEDLWAVAQYGWETHRDEISTRVKELLNDVLELAEEYLNIPIQLSPEEHEICETCSDLRGQLDCLEEENNELSDDLRNLTFDLDELRKERDNLESQVYDLEVDLNNLQTHLTSIEKETSNAT